MTELPPVNTPNPAELMKNFAQACIATSPNRNSPTEALPTNTPNPVDLMQRFAEACIATSTYETPVRTSTSTRSTPLPLPLQPVEPPLTFIQKVKLESDLTLKGLKTKHREALESLREDESTEKDPDAGSPKKTTKAIKEIVKPIWKGATALPGKIIDSLRYGHPHIPTRVPDPFQPFEMPSLEAPPPEPPLVLCSSAIQHEEQIPVQTAPTPSSPPIQPAAVEVRVTPPPREILPATYTEFKYDPNQPLLEQIATQIERDGQANISGDQKVMNDILRNLLGAQEGVLETQINQDTARITGRGIKISIGPFRVTIDIAGQLLNHGANGLRFQDLQIIVTDAPRFSMGLAQNEALKKQSEYTKPEHTLNKELVDKFNKLLKESHKNITISDLSLHIDEGQLQVGIKGRKI